MADGVLVDSRGIIVSVVYGFTGSPPDGQTFVATSTRGAVVGQIVSAGSLQTTTGATTTITITSASDPALNGTYACSAAIVASIQNQMTALLNSSFTTFYGGATTVTWNDVSGAAHVFTPAQFRAFAVAMSGYLNSLYTAAGQIASNMPPATATIP